MGFASLGILAIGVVVLVLAVAGILAMIKSQGAGMENHPSTFSSQTRAALRPLHKAVEQLGLAVTDKKNEAAKVIGPQALEAARDLVKRAGDMGRTRDQLLELIGRSERAGTDASQAKGTLARIDAQIQEATIAVDGMTMRVLSRAPSLPDDASVDDVADLVTRLQNIGSSFDEVYHEAEESTRA